MNHAPFWPLVWKEYRAGRAFWLAMAAMGLVAQGAAAWLSVRPADRNWWLYAIALMISTGFAVGIGGTLFAIEHEDRTFGLLRMLPVKAKELGAAKLLCAFAGLVALVGLLWLTASALAGWQSLPASESGELWGLWGLACLEGFAWGVLCSLVFSSPLRATMLALVGVTVSIQAAVTLTSRHNLGEIASYIDAIPYRMVLLAIVAAVDAWLLPRWLTGRIPQAATQRSAGRPGRKAKVLAAWNTPAPHWAAPLGHLMWQAWREVTGSAWQLVAWAVASILSSIFIVALMSTGVLYLGEMWRESPIVNGVRLLPWFAVVPIVLATSFWGSLAFRLDPMWGSRFLAERGVSSRLVWVSRQLVWGGWLVGLLLAVGCLSIVLRFVPHPVVFDALQKSDIQAQYNAWTAIAWTRDVEGAIFRLSAHEIGLNAFLLWSLLFSTYAVAQLFSMVVRRRLLAAVFSAMVGILAAGWAYLMFALDVPWWWSVLPLGIGCLLATWLRTPGWLMAERGLRDWIWPVAAAVAPLFFLVFAVPEYRVAEISAPGLTKLAWSDESESPRGEADAKAARHLYESACDLLMNKVFTDADWRKAADLVIEANAYKSFWLPEQSPGATLRAASTLQRLGWFLPAYAQTQQESGKLDRAWDLYMAALNLADHFDQCAPSLPNHNYDSSIRSRALAGLASWAGAPRQTAEALRQAIERLDKYHASMPDPAVRLRSWHRSMTLAVTDLPGTLLADAKPRFATTEQWITSRLPWERERALRLINVIFNIESGRVRRDFESELRSGMPVGNLLSPAMRHSPPSGQMQFVDNWSTEWPLNQWWQTTPLVSVDDLPAWPFTWFLTAEETDFRATKIVLALEAWKIDHGQLPDKLEELAPSELSAVPLDPVWAEPFLYYPGGLSTPPDDRIVLSTSAEGLEQQEANERYQPNRIIDWPKIDGRPFLWSALSPVPGVQPISVGRQRSYQQQTVATYYYLVDRADSGWWVPAVPDTSVLSAGQAYVIPAKEDHVARRP